ncbi:hypothetical protein HK100_008697, partial [Physocladia obscura]
MRIYEPDKWNAKVLTQKIQTSASKLLLRQHMKELFQLKGISSAAAVQWNVIEVEKLVGTSKNQLQLIEDSPFIIIKDTDGKVIGMRYRN